MRGPLVHFIASLALWLLALPAAGACLYLLALTALSAPLAVPAVSTRKLKFEIIVPAHNEETVLAHVIRSLLRIDWPAQQFRVVVVADNCTDATAAIAASAGAHVLARSNQEKRGKGYALDLAFTVSRELGWADAVVVIDADAEVSTNLLEAIACRIESGEHAVQVHYGVSNIGVSWRTRLLGIAKAAFHIVRSRARERLKLSCGIRGNGWAVTRGLLERVPYKAFSLTEDLEYGITLGLAGYRVAYADEAHSNAEMVSGEKESRNQRQRWESGRFELIRNNTFPLLAQAIRRRSVICLDLALDLMVLPLSYIVLNVLTLLVLTLIALAAAQASISWLWICGACIVALTLHILRGWQLSGVGLRGLLDLGRAPFFLAWKIMIMIRARGSKEWVRTKREGS
jgi:cellulose synthase/poly-beta-1,6-N-acetylglucosamine synthase-like glycosyltransferase